MRFAFLLVLFFYFLQAQAFAGFFLKNKNLSEDLLSVYVKYESTLSSKEELFLLKGAVSRMVFTVENDSSDFIVIRNFDIQNQLPDIYRWYGAVYGGIEYMPLEDVWMFSELEQRLSEPIFAMGVIHPGGRLDVIRHVILRKDHIDIALTYQKLSKKEARRFLYFYFRDDKALGVHRTYEHHKNIDSMQPEEIYWEMVIFPEADAIPFEKHVFSCQVSLKEPVFSLKNAEEKIGVKAESFVYWKQQGAWIIGKDKDRYMITQEEITKLPEMDLFSFVVIESSYKTIDVILPMSGYDRFKAAQPTIEGPGYFNPGVTPLKEDKVLPLFAFAREKGDPVTVLAYDPTGLGRQFYLLVGDFDEKKRRNIIGGER